MAPNSVMSAMNTLTFTTSSHPAPAATRMRSMFCNVWVVSGPMPPPTSASPSPEPNVPATKIRSSVRAAWENWGSRPRPSTTRRSFRDMHPLNAIEAPSVGGDGAQQVHPSGAAGGTYAGQHARQCSQPHEDDDLPGGEREDGDARRRCTHE